MRRLEGESVSLDEKLQRAIQQRQKLKASIQQRRTAATAAGQPPQQNQEDAVCNAEMQYHVESLTALLRGLYRTMG